MGAHDYMAPMPSSVENSTEMRRELRKAHGLPPLWPSPRLSVRLRGSLSLWNFSLPPTLPARVRAFPTLSESILHTRTSVGLVPGRSCRVLPFAFVRVPGHAVCFLSSMLVPGFAVPVCFLSSMLSTTVHTLGSAPVTRMCDPVWFEDSQEKFTRTGQQGHTDKQTAAQLLRPIRAHHIHRAGLL